MKFGVREVVDLTFKATANGQKVGNEDFKAGQPVFHIDTARTSTLEQATATTYAQGGQGYARLLAWEGEKTMTFTVEDAMMSPMGLAVLSGAGLIKKEPKHVHMVLDVYVNSESTYDLSLETVEEELGMDLGDDGCKICCKIPTYGTILDGSGAGIGWIDKITVGDKKDVTDVDLVRGAPVTFTLGKSTADESAANKTVKLDFYVVLETGVTEVTIAPEDFGGYFYVEAQTLFRREDNGKDMAAEIILPKVKIQSGFTFTMASSGDPSTFTFTMDAFPGYTYFDRTKKVMCVFQIIGSDGNDDKNKADTEIQACDTMEAHGYEKTVEEHGEEEIAG